MLSGGVFKCSHQSGAIERSEEKHGIQGERGNIVLHLHCMTLGHPFLSEL